MSCQICESDTNLQTHHDSYSPEITRTLCVSCHQDQHKGHGVGIAAGMVAFSVKFLENKDEFSRLWNNDFTYNELMNRFDISFVTVYNWSKRLNLSRRKHFEYKYNPKDFRECQSCPNSYVTRCGAYRNKTGLYQRYKCRNCGSTWIGEKPIVESKEDSR